MVAFDFSLEKQISFRTHPALRGQSHCNRKFLRKWGTKPQVYFHFLLNSEARSKGEASAAFDLVSTRNS